MTIQEQGSRTAVKALMAAGLSLLFLVSLIAGVATARPIDGPADPADSVAPSEPIESSRIGDPKRPVDSTTSSEPSESSQPSTPSASSEPSSPSAARDSAEAEAGSYRQANLELADGGSLALRWNPCQAITYTINVSGLPTSERSVVVDEIKQAVEALAKATGLSYAYRGQTSTIPQSGNAPNQPAELVIAVVGSDSTDINIGGERIGFGGYHYWQWSMGQGSRRATEAVIARGWVVIDAADLMRQHAGFGPGATRGNVLLHELGHTVGLEHVDDPSQLMYGNLLNTSPDGYASGDLAGLRQVGRTQGCVSVPDGVVEDLT